MCLTVPDDCGNRSDAKTKQRRRLIPPEAGKFTYSEGKLDDLLQKHQHDGNLPIYPHEVYLRLQLRNDDTSHDRQQRDPASLFLAVTSV